MPKQKQDNDEASSKRSWTLLLGRLIITVFFMLMILYAGLLLIARTDGFNYCITERLSELTGLSVSIQTVRVKTDLALALEEVRIAAAQSPPRAVSRIEHAILEWSMTGLFARRRPFIDYIELRNCEFVFERDEAGEWQPAPFVGEGFWLAGQLRVTPLDSSMASPVASEKEPRRKSNRGYHLRNARVVFKDPGGRMSAFIEGLDVISTPLRLPGRHMNYYRLQADRVSGASGTMRPEIVLEVLRMPQKDVVLHAR